METNEQEIDEPVLPIGPGARLREAREAAGLSREEVAARLRLRLELVRALEEDDYDHLPSSAFVSGYLRSYARLLELSADEIVAAYARPVAEPTLISPVMPPRQRRSGDLPVKVVTYLIIALLVVLAMVWWAARRPSTPTPSTAPAVLKHGGTVELTLPPPSGGSAASGMPATVAPAPLPSVSPSSAAGTPAGTPAPAKVPAAPVTAAPVSLAPAEIQLEASADCWIRINDATGQRVAFELLKGGTNRTILGKAPFDVFLGYAPGVKVYYQGKLFDPTPFEHGNEAHFKLGKASDNTIPGE